MAYQLFEMITGEGQVICTGHTKIIVPDLVESGVVILGRFLVFTRAGVRVGRSDSDAVRLFWLVRLLSDNPTVRLFWLVRLLSDFSREKNSTIALFAVFMTSYIAVTSNYLC